jgi:hypothetical protein
MDGITLKNIEEIAPYSGPHAISGIRFRSAREVLGVASWGMSFIEMDPHCSGYPKHDHGDDGHEEVYLVLRGSIVLVANDTERVLREGDVVRVAPKSRANSSRASTARHSWRSAAHLGSRTRRPAAGRATASRSGTSARGRRTAAPHLVLSLQLP